MFLFLCLRQVGLDLTEIRPPLCLLSTRMGLFKIAPSGAGSMAQKVKVLACKPVKSEFHL